MYGKVNIVHSENYPLDTAVEIMLMSRNRVYQSVKILATPVVVLLCLVVEVHGRGFEPRVKVLVLSEAPLANALCQPPTDRDADLDVLGWGF